LWGGHAVGLVCVLFYESPSSTLTMPNLCIDKKTAWKTTNRQKISTAFSGGCPGARCDLRTG
jgi:hypothetical protein